MEAITNGMMNLNRQRHQHLVALRIIFAEAVESGAGLSILAALRLQETGETLPGWLGRRKKQFPQTL